MWIAKAVTQLNPLERAAWNEVPAKPLSQTLAWAEAGLRLGASADLIMSLDRPVGGIVIQPGGVPGADLECINGPILDWDSPALVRAQLGTFAMAVRKLHPQARSLTLRPRWEAHRLTELLEGLPLEPRSISEASTRVIPIEVDSVTQERNFSSRLRRTLKQTREQGGVTTFATLAGSPQSGESETQGLAIPAREVSTYLGDFVAREAEFGRKKGFFVPPQDWFQTLIESPAGEMSFYACEANLPNAPGSPAASLLIAVLNSHAHFLYGHDHRNGDDDRDGSEPASPSARISLAALAHARVLDECRKLGLRSYDLNGFTDPSDPNHPYAGVSAFKAQFGGVSVDYACPEFAIALRFDDELLYNK